MAGFASTTSACDTRRISLVDESDDNAADFGRKGLLNAVVKLSATPDSPEAYATFAKTVKRLEPQFNREVARDAELRLAVLALGPLQSGVGLSAEAQMQRFATTVWPTILNFPAKDKETAQAYAKRVCGSDLALACSNVVPEEWPVILNARVWRTLKSRVLVAYDRCQWCEDDPKFPDILAAVRSSQLRAELDAQEAIERGHPSQWPRAGQHAGELATELVVSFGNDGLVTVAGGSALGGDWRQAIRNRRGDNDLLALHLRPERMVSELLNILKDVKQAGYARAALVVRDPHFPYSARQYLVDTQVQNAKDMGVRASDSLQVLVQSLELRASQLAASEGKR